MSCPTPRGTVERGPQDPIWPRKKAGADYVASFSRQRRVPGAGKIMYESRMPKELERERRAAKSAKSPVSSAWKEKEIEKFVDWSFFVDELNSGNERGIVLALTARVEASCRSAVAKLMGDAPDARGYQELPFAKAIRTLEKFRVISGPNADLLHELRQLRNAAAHSPAAFRLYDKKRRKPGRKARSYHQRASRIVTKMRRLIDGVRGDPAWHEFAEEGFAGDFKIAIRLLWEGLQRAERDVKPLVSPRRPVVFDLLAQDPTAFCVGDFLNQG